MARSAGAPIPALMHPTGKGGGSWRDSAGASRGDTKQETGSRCATFDAATPGISGISITPRPARRPRLMSSNTQPIASTVPMSPSSPAGMGDAGAGGEWVGKIPPVAHCSYPGGFCMGRSTTEGIWPCGVYLPHMINAEFK